MKMMAAVMAFIFASVSHVSEATQSSSANDSVTYYVPLQDSHLIVRGTVTRVVGERTTLGNFGAVPKEGRGANWPIDVAHVHFDVKDVLKGVWPRDAIVFTLRGSGSNFRPGTEMIVCARRWVKGNEEMYAVGEHLGLFEKGTGNVWIAVTSDPMLPRKALEYAALIASVRQAGAESVTADADVVARGIIVGVRTTEYRSPDGRIGLMTRYLLRVSKLLKGGALSGQIEFVVPRIDSSYVPGWTRLVPNGIEKGQEWYVFLREGDMGLYPFAGPNSLLLVTGQKLIYDMSVEYPLGANDMDRIVRSESASEE